MTDMAEYKENVADYGLDIHCQMIIEEFRDSQDIFKKLKDVVVESLRKKLRSIHMVVDLVEARVKTEESLVGKLEMKGAKYKTLSDVTDIVGARIVSFYTDEVDKVAAMVESLFDVDWDNSVDKRKLLKVDSFGYMSLHYVCRIPESLYRDPEHPELNQIRFEVQMRTALQHVWASMNHDIGYKSGVEVPGDYLRSLMRLAGMLELADVEFSRIRKEITDYRRKVEGLVKSGNFADITINADSFRSYLALDPFSALNSKIAAINQAEIQQVNGMSYVRVLGKLGFKTLGDVEILKKEYFEPAYQLAVRQISSTDLDIIASTLGLHNLCLAYCYTKGGLPALTYFYETLEGKSAYNEQSAQRALDHLEKLPCYRKKQN